MSCSGEVDRLHRHPGRASNVQGMPKPTAAIGSPTAVRISSTASATSARARAGRDRAQAVGTVMNREVRVDRAGQQLGAAEVDADDASLGARRPRYRSPWPTARRSRAAVHPLPLAAAPSPAARARRAGRPARARRGPRPGEPAPARRTPDHVGASSSGSRSCSGLAAVSLVLFLISAQIESSKSLRRGRSAAQRRRLPAHVAEHGPRARLRRAPEGHAEPGADHDRRASRSDSIMLMRVGGGANARLSIPRDTVVDIPGHGPDKINAAYAIGGPALAITTVKQYLGIKINHLVEVNFENFPELIDALGGIDLHRQLRHLQDQRRQPQRRLHAAPEGRDARAQRQAGARPGAHAAQRLPPAGGRPHARAPPAEDPLRDQGPGDLVRDVHPPALGLVGGARRRSARTCPAPRCSASSAPS